MPRVQSALDLVGNELRNAKLQNLAADPSGLVSGDAARVWYNTTSNRAKIWNGTAVENLTTILEAVATGTTALQVSTSTKTATLTIADATGSNSGLMSPTSYNAVTGATNANTGSSIVQRDASGNFSAGTITAALTGTASNATNLGGQTLAQVRDFSLTTGVRTHTAISDFDTQVQTSRLDQMAPPTAPVSANSQRITNLADPTGAQDAATKNYVDNVATGLDAKASVVYGTTAALPSCTYANGASGVGATLTATANAALSVDSQTVSAGQRILVKNQAAPAQNGIYTVTQPGTGAQPFILTRATDSDTAAEVTGGMFTFIEGGTTLASSGWVLSLTGAVTIGTTSLSFAQFSGSGSYQAGNGINLAGSVFSVTGTANRISVGAGGVDISAAYVGQTSITTLGTIATGVWNGSAVPVANGGTGATTAAAARTNLAATGKAAVNVPAGTTYSFTHSLNSTDVGAFVIDLATGDIVLADLKVVDANTVSVTFGSSVSANAYRLVVVA